MNRVLLLTGAALGWSAGLTAVLLLKVAGLAPFGAWPWGWVLLPVWTPWALVLVAFVGWRRATNDPY